MNSDAIECLCLEISNKKSKNIILSLNIVTRTERQSGNTGRLNRNLYVILKFTKRPKTSEITFEKTWLFLKGISYLQVSFMLF